MATGDARNLTDREIVLKQREIVQDLVLTRFQHSTAQLERTADLRRLRRDLARMRTLIRQREIERGMDRGALEAAVGSVREEGPAMARVQERYGRQTGGAGEAQ